MSGPNPLAVLRSMLRARRTRVPHPSGTGRVDHGRLGTALAAAASGGVAALEEASLVEYIDAMATVDPDTLSPPEALAYWLNLYNAGALDLARRAYDHRLDTVLRVPGGFTAPYVAVRGEQLSLDDVEHGKIRRFGDPRIHGALVCGSVSCPTLRFEPYRGSDLDDQLDNQMRAFLATGGAVVTPEEGLIELSRVFLWYGGDFTRPGRMPTLLPSRRRPLLGALARWLDPETAAWVAEAGPRVAFQAYDWGLGCAVRTPPGTVEPR
jgi:hypothetical protein